MKKYYLYLDESGDFDKDLDPASWKNASLVGGILWARDSKLNTNALLGKIEKILDEENHATEISRDKKGLLVYQMLTAAKEFPLEFVIFQNDIKKKIITSTQTYLTVITEGLLQLLKTLVIVEADAVEIDVVVGFKKDTTQTVTASFVEGYIPKEEYTSRLSEKITIEKAKLKDEEFQRSKINLTLADDKRNSYLVLCDYVCNFWYTRQARAFTAQIEHGGKQAVIRDVLEDLYREDYIFPLFSTEENEHVLRMIQDGVYADALFEWCAGALSDPNERRVLQSFLKLRPKQIHRQLDSLADYIGEFITFQLEEEGQLVENILNKAYVLYEYLLENGIHEKKYYLDVQLYKLAFCNRFSRWNDMEELFGQIESAVADYALRTLDMDYLLIYYTRKAVYLQDRGRYEESVKVCDDMELLLMEVEEALLNNECVVMEGKTKCEQLGKVLGTKLQAMIRLCMNHPERYEDAREVSDRAIAQFEYPIDLYRQYQYRAELEAVCNRPEDALKWLELSFGSKGWKEHISSADCGMYDVYNLLFVAAFAREQSPELGEEIANLVFTNCQEELQEPTSIGATCRFFLGHALILDKKYGGRGGATLKKLIKDLSESNMEDVQFIKAAEISLAGGNGLQYVFN